MIDVKNVNVFLLCLYILSIVKKKKQHRLYWKAQYLMLLVNSATYSAE